MNTYNDTARSPLRATAVLICACFMPGLGNSAEFDISALQPGELRSVVVNGSPVHLYRRTDDEIQTLLRHPGRNDPQAYAAMLVNTARIFGNESASLIARSADIEMTPLRSYDNEFLIVFGHSANRGCYVSFNENRKLFHDPCEEDNYDLAGRNLSGTSAPHYHLLIPAHNVHDGTVDFVEQPDELIDFTPDIAAMSIPVGEKLDKAIQWRKFELAAALVRKFPVTVSYRTRVGASPLHIAAGKAPTTLLGLLIDQGADVNELTDAGYTPLHMAVLADNKANATYLIQRGAKLDGHCVADHCMIPIFDALRGWHPDMSEDEVRTYLADIGHPRQ